MSEIYTRIVPKDGRGGEGFMCHGRVTVNQAISDIRRYAAQIRAVAEKIERTQDHEFAVDIVRGSIIEKHVETLQSPLASEVGENGGQA